MGDKIGRFNPSRYIKDIYTQDRARPSYADGGTVQNIGGYRIHIFSTTGSSTFTSFGSLTVDYLIIGGGGAGGADMGGGGGAGGYVYGSTVLGIGSYSITVGNGGSGPTGEYNVSTIKANSGQNSSAFGLTAVGGGAGGSGHRTDTVVSFAPESGGSGGGAAGRNTLVGNGTAGQGFGGSFTGLEWRAGCGGGAGAAGNSNTAGGDGLQNSILGQSFYWAGGGGGGGYTVGSGNGGLGGGGGGGGGTAVGTGGSGYNAGAAGVGIGTTTGLGGAAGANTGGGGGGSAHQRGTVNSRGGSGIVIVRYVG